jgi:hypothetical protein
VIESSTIDELINERDELLRENNNLRQENQEMAELLAEYERGMTTTTELIRDYAVYPFFLVVSNIKTVSIVHPNNSNTPGL